MFTVKPANDTEEFYEAIRGQATVRARQALAPPIDHSEPRHGSPILQPSGGTSTPPTLAELPRTDAEDRTASWDQEGSACDVSD